MGDDAGATFFAVQRHEIGQRSRCDDDATSVFAGIAGEVFELEREIDQFADFVVAGVGLAQVSRDAFRFALGLLAAAQCIFQRNIEWSQRNRLGDPINLRIAHAKYATTVAQHGLRRHGAVGDDLADLVAAVFVGHVVDDAIAAIHAEVDVEVRHRHALGIEEALE